MKHFTLITLVACLTSLNAWAQSSTTYNIAYNLDGGQWNQYGWNDKGDMLVAFLTDGGANSGYTTIADYQAMVGQTLEGQTSDGLHSPGLCVHLTTAVANKAYENTEKWGWLQTYCTAVETADGKSFSAHYSTGAFFISGQSTRWPTTASYAEAGKPSAFEPEWGHVLSGPATYDGTVEITLPTPYKAGFEFEGWFEEGSETPVTAIAQGSTGDKSFTARWKSSSTFDITYHLNEGQWNEYGWTSKTAMLEAFCADYNSVNGQSREWGATTQPGNIFANTYSNTGADLIGAVFNDAMVGPKWAWLKAYILKVAEDAGHASLSGLQAGTIGYWRSAIDGFFTSTQCAGNNVFGTPDFTEAGKPEAFEPAWGHVFSGPATYDGTAEITLPTPYKAGFDFEGWYENADLEGTAVTEIAQGRSGAIDLYAKWKATTSVALQENAVPSLRISSSGLLSETVAQVEVYAVSGQCVFAARNVNAISVPMQGVYVVKALRQNGEQVVEKYLAK